ncbi:MAG: hypothetical protein CMM06_08095 [Rhodopirellula sp.]|nr:hypothetical protein [Rhodopirellula sp.]|tara:strand:+ start:9450 stop:10724 length:1275 start_codon:yes stop_codon:yes gene_type:complete
MSRRVYKRAGVTIIEVLFAIGIVIMGLMGIAGLIMIAGSQLTQGLKADGMSNLGLNAVEEFDMRHLRHQSGLLRYDATNSTFVNLQTAESYCIDPYFIAHQVFDGNTNVSQLSRFPGLAIPSGNPNQLTVMPRVTLANVPGIVNDPAFYDPNTYGVGVARIMNKLQAQELFTSRDNLALRESDVATELPKQVWFEDRQTPLAASPRTSDSIDNDHDGYTDEADEAFVKRIGFGDMARLGATEFSWMATVTPDRTFIINAAGNSAGRDTTDQYLVSIVVFHNRAFHYNNQATLEDQERMLEVTLRGNGYGGGEIRLHSANIPALDIKHNDWIMLSAQSSLGPQFRWYRISFIDDEVQTAANGTFYRDATIQGPDWNRAEWLPTVTPNTTGPPTVNPPQYKTHATFVPRVIGVFEKTIRIETTSLY